MRVLVTGSRNWADWSVVERVLLDICAATAPTVRPVLVVGDAAGADAIAREVWRRMGWPVEVYRAKWKQYGKRAGFLRNQAMVDSGADVCVAFIKDASRGATMTANLAEAAGIPVRRYTA